MRSLTSQVLAVCLLLVSLPSCSDHPQKVDPVAGPSMPDHPAPLPGVPVSPGPTQNPSIPQKPGPANQAGPSPSPTPPVMPDPVVVATELRLKSCPPARSSNELPLFMQAPSAKPRQIPDPDYAAIRDTLKTGCAGCHLAPGANLGNFSYVDSYNKQTLLANGVTQTVLGLSESAAVMQAAVADGSMPPPSLRKQNPQLYTKLGEQLAAWIARKMPEQQTEEATEGAALRAVLGLTDTSGFSDLGDCVPVADPAHEAKAGDAAKDSFFAGASALPTDLKDTDFFTVDAAILAQHGTYSYDVEYPLWTDNMGKARLVHVPQGAHGPEAIQYDESTKKFHVPDNTRFYKSFYRGVKRLDGRLAYRPIETRLIVVRHDPAKPLYGTYVWNDAGTAATLLQDPYRDGTPWKDKVLELTVDEGTKATRNYAVPARHRCEQCHKGGDDSSFVLGFTPLQINRRALGGGGRQEPIGADELAQAQRLLDLGVTAGYDAQHPLPKLEDYPSTTPPSVYTMRAQGYMLGNCAHCHNPNGFAMKDNKVTLDLSAGELFHFDIHSHSINSNTKRFVDHYGNLDLSYLYKRVSATRDELGFDSQMPLHSPGGPDCRGLTLIGQWIRSFDQTATADELDHFQPTAACTSDEPVVPGDFAFVPEDFTTVPGPYAPRRLDWAEASGMPDSYRKLQFDAGLQALVSKPVPVDFWRPDSACDFSKNTPLAPADARPWMKRPSGALKQPLNQVYYATPGAWFFTSTCSLCHGRYAKGDGEIGQHIATWSGGEVTVADFAGGMFGAKGDNLKVFNQVVGGETVNLAPNYLIWMAMEGTKVNLPAAATQYLGPHKTQMLRQIRDRCGWLIPSSQQTLTPRVNAYEVFAGICTYENLPVTAPEIQYDPDTGLPVNQVALDKWLDKAALNAGYAIYSYLQQATAKEQWLPTQGECAKAFPAGP